MSNDISYLGLASNTEEIYHSITIKWRKTSFLIEKEWGDYNSTNISSNLCLLVLQLVFLKSESEKT